MRESFPSQTPGSPKKDAGTILHFARKGRACLFLMPSRRSEKGNIVRRNGEEKKVYARPEPYPGCRDSLTSGRKRGGGGGEG